MKDPLTHSDYADAIVKVLEYYKVQQGYESFYLGTLNEPQNDILTDAETAALSMQ